MKLKNVKNALTSKVGRQILLLDKHSPSILFVGGVVGVVGATVLACKATLKLDEILDAHDDKRVEIKTAALPGYSDRDRQRDLVIHTVRTAKDVAVIYAPAVAVGVVSIACLTRSHNILMNRNAALMAAYSALDRGFREYRARVVDEVGPAVEQQLYHGSEAHAVVEKTEKGTKTSQIAIASQDGSTSPYSKWFAEGTASEWSPNADYNLTKLKIAQAVAQDQLESRGHLFLNEVYHELGIPETQAGCVVGWVWQGNGDNYVDFGLFENDPQKAAFVQGVENSVLLDFNVDGVIYDLLSKY